MVTVALLIFDARTPFFDSFRYSISNINLPFYRVLDWPFKAKDFVGNYWPNQELLDKFDRLQSENKMLHAKVQKYDALALEKQRLTRLLSAREAKSDEQMMLGRVVRVELNDDADQRYVIDRGQSEGVYLSQPAIDDLGVIGQVSFVGSTFSVVTLITDSSHALPVQLQRNGIRMIARGQGDDLRLNLPFLSFQTDIREGDVLVTSGLGDVFPPGYRVGEVTSVVADTGEAFKQAFVRPYSNIGMLKEVLLLGTAESVRASKRKSSEIYSERRE